MKKKSNKPKTPRRPVGYWLIFNDWWRSQLDILGRRPVTSEIARWYNQHADAAWEADVKPSWKDTRIHAKCLRSTEAVKEYFRKYRASKKEDGSDDQDTFESSEAACEADLSALIQAHNLRVADTNSVRISSAARPSVDPGFNHRAHSAPSLHPSTYPNSPAPRSPPDSSYHSTGHMQTGGAPGLRQHITSTVSPLQPIRNNSLPYLGSSHPIPNSVAQVMDMAMDTCFRDSDDDEFESNDTSLTLSQLHLMHRHSGERSSLPHMGSARMHDAQKLLLRSSSASRAQPMVSHPLCVPRSSSISAPGENFGYMGLHEQHHRPNNYLALQAAAMSNPLFGMGQPVPDLLNRTSNNSSTSTAFSPILRMHSSDELAFADPGGRQRAVSCPGEGFQDNLACGAELLSRPGLPEARMSRPHGMEVPLRLQGGVMTLSGAMNHNQGMQLHNNVSRSLYAPARGWDGRPLFS